MTLDALKRLVRAYPGGTEAVAQRLGKHPGTLRSELQPPAGSSAKLGWLDAVDIMAMARQVGMPEALTPLDLLEAEFGRVFIKALDHADDGEGLMRGVAGAAEAFGQLVSELATSAADGTITDNELGQIRTKASALLGGVHRLLAHVGDLNARGKPAQLQRVA
jgi:hypothetical protein